MKPASRLIQDTHSWSKWFQGAKKPTKPPPKDDKKKKPERQGQGVPPEPLDEATATALAPIQFAMAREAVVSALDDLETLFPLCE